MKQASKTFKDDFLTWTLHLKIILRQYRVSYEKKYDSEFASQAFILFKNLVIRGFTQVKVFTDELCITRAILIMQHLILNFVHKIVSQV